MNILYIVNYFPPSTGAAALNALEISKYLIKFGHNINILAPGDMGKTLNLKNSLNLQNSYGLNISYSNSYIKTPLSWVVSHFENFLRFLIRKQNFFKPDLILSQYHPFHFASVFGGYLSKFLNIPHIIRSHDIFLDLDSHSRLFNSYIKLNYPLVYRSIQNCHTFYVTASEMIDYFHNFKNLHNVNFKIHHNGIDTDLFFPFKNQEKLKDLYGCEIIISFIGLMAPDIGIHNLINIFPEILKKTKKEVHIVLIGEGRSKNYILNLINKWNLHKYIHFLGIMPHNQIPYFINNSDLGIGRITHKKMWRYMVPIKCLEYMACQKPFISTPISMDVLKDNDVGLLLQKDFTNKDLIDKMLMLIEDKKLRNKLGEQGLKKVHQEFRWELIMKNFNQDLRNIKK